MAKDITIWNMDSSIYDPENKQQPIPDNTDFVDLITNQTVWWIKTFSSSPIVPTPTTDFQVATKEYVDNNSWWTILSAVIAWEIIIWTVIEMPVSKTITAGTFRVSLKTLPFPNDAIVKLYKNNIEDASVTIPVSATLTNWLYQWVVNTFVSGSYVAWDVLKASVTQIGSTLAGTGLSILLNE